MKTTCDLPNWYHWCGVSSDSSILSVQCPGVSMPHVPAGVSGLGHLLPHKFWTWPPAIREKITRQSWPVWGMSTEHLPSSLPLSVLVTSSLTDGICHLCSWEYPQPITSPASLSASLSRTRDIIGHRATQMSFIFTCFQTFIAFLCKCYDSMDSLPISYEKTTITNSDVTFLTGKCLSGST